MNLNLMHGFRFISGRLFQLQFKEISVRPFSIFPSHFPSLLQIGREGFWMNIQMEVWETVRKLIS